MREQEERRDRLISDRWSTTVKHNSCWRERRGLSCLYSTEKPELEVGVQSDFGEEEEEEKYWAGPAWSAPLRKQFEFSTLQVTVSISNRWVT